MEENLENRISKLENSMFHAKSILNFEEACDFLNLSKSYLYKMTSSGQIPHYKPQGKMLYFEKTELEKWLCQNPVKTNQQVMQEAESFLMKKR